MEIFIEDLQDKMEVTDEILSLWTGQGHALKMRTSLCPMK